MKWFARIFVFFGALIVGIFVSSLFAPAPVSVAGSRNVKGPLTAQNLLGTWTGSWGHDDGRCTLIIDRVDGNEFAGTLRKNGAAIRFEGTFDPSTRKFTFNETKILTLGAEFDGWSLGKNNGIISPDGRILVGDGQDEWGQYGWAASNY